jgi:hypothetical protein
MLSSTLRPAAEAQKNRPNATWDNVVLARFKRNVTDSAALASYQKRAHVMSKSQGLLEHQRQAPAEAANSWAVGAALTLPGRRARPSPERRQTVGSQLSLALRGLDIDNGLAIHLPIAIWWHVRR